MTNQELAESLKIDTDTLRKYRNLLHEASIIKVTNPSRVGEKIRIEYNNDIESWQVPGED